MNHYQAPQDDMMAALQGLGGISVESKMLDLAFVLVSRMSTFLVARL